MISPEGEPRGLALRLVAGLFGGAPPARSAIGPCVPVTFDRKTCLGSMTRECDAGTVAGSTGRPPGRESAACRSCKLAVSKQLQLPIPRRDIHESVAHRRAEGDGGRRKARRHRA